MAADDEVRRVYKEIGHQVYEAIINVVSSALRPDQVGPYDVVVLAALTRATATFARDVCALSVEELVQYVGSVAAHPDALVLIESANPNKENDDGRFRS